MTKNFRAEHERGRKRFYSTRELKRPIMVTDINMTHEIKNLIASQKVFETKYDNKFLGGTIDYTRYKLDNYFTKLISDNYLDTPLILTPQPVDIF
jgi:hypothetical protein